ncbi:MAG: hypothetical protein US89_C0004G0061 [Candidatus Peregrinibacteria bacterium GW2011_GWF2_38_29]|nr:MAG: hypothetical protein US89_C0004G0061 [Candidatus Peregrinibacteria bacterium GW2011_GWF2_38_29]HBB02998.1 hypothetical protein [Candidatus Peregrinibacteria bacterium]
MFRKFLAFVLVVVLLVFSVPATIFFGFYNTIFNYDFYEGPLLNNVYNQGVPILIEEMVSQDNDMLGKYFTRDELFELFKKDIPVTAFQTIVRGVTSQVDGILRGNGKTKITIQFDSLKPYFDVLIINFTNELFDKKIPKCEVGQKIVFKDLPSCVKPDTDFYKKGFVSQMQKNFDEIFKSKASSVEIDATPVLQNFQAIQGFSVLTQAFFMFLAILCLLILLVLWKPFSRGFKWLGVVFFIVSFNALVFYKTVSILSSYIDISNIGFPEKYIPEVRNIIDFIVNSFKNQMLYVLGFALLFGLALYLIGHLKSINNK